MVRTLIEILMGILYLLHPIADSIDPYLLEFLAWIMHVRSFCATGTLCYQGVSHQVKGPIGRLWCINGVGDGPRPLCRFSGDLPGDRHAEAGHAVYHLAGNPGIDLLRGQSPGADTQDDQNLVPLESGFSHGPLSVSDGFLPADPAFPGEHLHVPVSLSGL